MKLVLAISLLGLALAGHSAEEWKSRTIYQVLTDRFARNDGDTSICYNLANYCGGGFVGLMNNLDYIQNMGFDAIWISPIVKNTPGGYHGYWTLDFYGINSHFGTEQDLANLISEMHRRDMWVMLDVVANHVGPIGTSLSNVGEINPFNQKSYYHPYCKINWDSKYSIENCWLADLPDLDQSNNFVRENLLKWISEIVTKHNIDGIRIDTCEEVPQWFWKQFNSSAGVFTICEVANGSVELNAGYQSAVDATLNYPLFYVLRNLFQKDNSFYNAVNFMHQSKNSYQDINTLGNFVDNHDQYRFLYDYLKYNRFKNALAFTMTWPGIPIVYYGDEQGYDGGKTPNNREILWTNLNNTSSEMYQFVSKIVHFRKEMELWKYDFVDRYHADNFYCFSRGKALMAFSNTDSNIHYTVSYHPYKVGDVICNIFYATDCVTVTTEGVPVYLDQGEVKLYKPKASSVVSA